MAKVRGGLFSIEASGQFAQSLVFDKRGYVREYKVPSNPKTGSQGDQRQKFLGMQRLVRSIGETYRDYIKADAPVSSRWHNHFVALMSDSYDSALAAYNALSTAEQSNWQNETMLSVPTLAVEVDYAVSSSPDAGFLAFLAAYTFYYRLGDPGLASDPTAAGAVLSWLTIFV